MKLEGIPHHSSRRYPKISLVFKALGGDEKTLKGLLVEHLSVKRDIFVNGSSRSVEGDPLNLAISVQE